MLIICEGGETRVWGRSGDWKRRLVRRKMFGRRLEGKWGCWVLGSLEEEIKRRGGGEEELMRRNVYCFVSRLVLFLL